MIRWREIVQPRMDEESATLRGSYACFQITVENRMWLLKNSPTGRSFDLGDFPAGVSRFLFLSHSISDRNRG